MVDNSYDGMFEAVGKYYNVDPQLLKAIYHKESSGNPNAPRGSSGEIGPMQIMPDTAHHLVVSDPSDMGSAVSGAARYIREGLDANNNDPIAAVRYYNGGPGGPSNPKTVGYANDIINLYPQMANKGQISNQGKPSTTSSTPDYEAMGTKLLQGGTSSPEKETSDPYTELGSKLLQPQAAPQAPPAAPQQVAPPSQPQATPDAPPQAATPLDQKMGMGSIRNALSGQPGDYQFGGAMSLLPMAHNDVTGQNRLAVPQAINNMGNGILDLIQGPNTGNVTPNARGVLTNMALGGKLNPQSAAAIPSSESTMLSQQFRKDPVAPGYNPTTAKGESSDIPSMVITPDAPKPDASATSKATSMFLDYIQSTAAHKLSTGVGAAAGAVVGGPIGAAIGGVSAAVLQPIVKNAIKGMAPNVQKAVMDAFNKRWTGQRPGNTPDPTDNKLIPNIHPTAPNQPSNYLMPQYAPEA